MIASHLKGIISVHLAIPYYQHRKDKAIIRFLLFIHKVSQSVATFCQCQELAKKTFLLSQLFYIESLEIIISV